MSLRKRRAEIFHVFRFSTEKEDPRDEDRNELPPEGTEREILRKKYQPPPITSSFSDRCLTHHFIVQESVLAQRLSTRLVTERLWVRIRPGAERFFLLSPLSYMKGVLNQVPLRDPTLQIIL